MPKKSQDSLIGQQLKKQLITRICELNIGDRLPPERELAEKFGVCRSTMNKALAELVDEGYLSRRVGAGTFVLPRPQPIAQLNSGKHFRGELIIVYPDFPSCNISERVRLTERMAMQRNLRLICVKIFPDADWNHLYELIGSCANLCGILLVATTPPAGDLGRLDELGCPVVVLGELDTPGNFRNFYTVCCDHTQSGFLKMDALLAAGHRKIGLISNEPASLAGQECLRGIKNALYHYKLRYQDLARPETAINFWENPMRAGYLQTLEVMRSHPDRTGLVVDTIPGALGALRALYELHLRCPDDVSIVTAFSHYGEEEFTCPRLSTVVEPLEQIITIAMDLVDRKYEASTRAITVEVSLIARESIRKI